MPSDSIQELFNQSNAIEAKRFWEELEAAIGRSLSSESVLDLGCGFPELFIHLFQNHPEKLKSYWGIEKLGPQEVSTTLPEVFSIEHGISLEEFIKWYIPEKFSFICLRNILHFIAPSHDDSIISFIKNHLSEGGIVYLEVIPQNSSINHGRDYPFDKQRYEKYLNAFHIVTSTEYEKHENVLKAILKFVE